MIISGNYMVILFETLIRVLVPIIVSAQLYIVVSSFRLGMVNKQRAIYSAELLVEFILFYVEYHLYLEIEDREQRIYQYHNWLYDHIGIGYDWLLFTAEILFIVLFFFNLNEINRFSDSHINRFSIKEAMDKLPNGVAFADMNGKIVFYNLKMKDIMQSIEDEAITDIENASVIKIGKGYWQLMSQEIRVNGELYKQLTAWDITEEHILNKELESKNVQLKNIQERLRAYSKEIDQVVISEEVLNARKEIHDSAGHVLLTSRYYLENPDMMDPDVLLQMLRQSNEYLLREAEEDAAAEDPWQSVLDLTDSIGVRMVINGDQDITSDPEKRLIISQAVSECAINLVKHANGNELYIDLRNASNGSGGIHIEITNNGDTPSGPINEAGGLKYVRRMVEEAGGRMKVFCEPVFRLEIILE